MNTVTLMGRLGKDPEVTYSKNNVALCKFALATNRFSAGEKKTDWHNIMCFDKTAKIAGEYLKKGNQVCIQGQLTYEQYEQHGETKYVTKVLVNRLHLVGKQENEVQKTSKIDLENIDDDLPF